MTVLDTRTPARSTPAHSTLDRVTARTARVRSYLMCAPTHFDVTYAINAWMQPGIHVDRDRAVAQWQALVETYRALGHSVELLEPAAGLPDMVFAANGALVVDGRAYGARFRHVERQAEAVLHAGLLREQGIEVVEPAHTTEGEGDFLVLASMILAGTGFRTSLHAHVEAAAALDRPVVSLELVDPRFYHLDTALAVLDDGNGEAPADIAYLPSAFSPHSRRTLRQLFPDAIECSEADALVLGLNAVSDGHHVVLPVQARDLAVRLAERGYTPVPVDVSELLKAGGSVKCCTQEHHA
ncbi:dimethylargininase [Aeromicrobium sp.]|uniref:dimethylargininase n=1 Tax=Aeromicrobium sp. TaxID=1871063 RepID=UPI0040332EA0